ncbi:hypothetical protein BDZ91DRAFT_852248 [Kalaharituber pfeilii]|nr:hypothetical protein BDZ91DRAFT_852248 [Kalaharituber pfeilii]
MSAQSQTGNVVRIPLESSVFRETLSEFRRNLRLKPAQVQDFENTTLESLKGCIDNIQTEQAKGRNMRNINRIRPFVDAMEQYGKIIEVFLNISEFVAFIWGPMKFLLQVTSIYINCFDIILEEYERLGECLPQFQEYDSLFQNNNYMRQVLGLVYQDILEFHSRALKIIQRPAWSLIFKAAWKDLANPLRHICEKLGWHKALIESQASLIEFKEAKRGRELERQAFEREENENRRRRKVEITNWLAAADTRVDQESFEELRHEYPGTGSWILKDERIKRWLDASKITDTELWLFGVPGAGKTVLASVIIEELEKIRRSALSSTGDVVAAIAYFYCRYRTDNKDNFNAVGRGILSHLIKHNEEIMPLIWEKLADSGEMTLKSSKLLIELLEVAIKDSKLSYIVIDGLDECDKTERKKIVSTLRSIAESINQQTPGTVHLLFISTAEGDIKRQLSDFVKVQLKPHDADLQRFIEMWGIKIQKRFKLPDKDIDHLKAKVLKRSQGMFLYCSIVLKHLYDQGTIAQLEKELSPNIFPTGLEKAYERIVSQIYSTSNIQMQNAAKILDLIACAKRPLKKHEVQAVFAIDVHERTVDFAKRALIDDVNDLCGSLIEVNKEGTIQFVHMTARIFLTKCSYVRLPSAEANLAHLCVNYLTFDCFNRTLPETEIRQFALDGHFSFQDYAALHWLDHIEILCTNFSDNAQQIAKIAGPLECFLQQQLNTQSDDWKEINIKQDIQSKFQGLEGFPAVYQALVQLVSGAAGSRKASRQDRTLGPFTLCFLHLQSHIIKARQQLEMVFQTLSLLESQSNLEQAYGMHWFKCSRPTCAHFSEGFTSRQTRDKHETRHERLFYCTDNGCPMADFGCCTLREYKTHIKNCHSALHPTMNDSLSSDFNLESMEGTPRFPSFQRLRNRNQAFTDNRFAGPPVEPQLKQQQAQNQLASGIKASPTPSTLHADLGQPILSPPLQDIGQISSTLSEWVQQEKQRAVPRPMVLLSLREKEKVDTMLVQMIDLITKCSRMCYVLMQSKADPAIVKELIHIKFLFEQQFEPPFTPNSKPNSQLTVSMKEVDQWRAKLLNALALAKKIAAQAQRIRPPQQLHRA